MGSDKGLEKGFTEKAKFELAECTKCVLTEGLNRMPDSPRVSSVCGRAGTNEPPKRRNSATEME